MPENYDEANPRLEALGGFLGLDRVIASLDSIHAGVTARGARMVMTSFSWLVEDGLRLDLPRQQNIYDYLNRYYWPIGYAGLRRLVDVENAVFADWARRQNVALVDIAALMLRDPELFIDAIHNNERGVRLRSWILLTNCFPCCAMTLPAGEFRCSRH